MKLTPEQRENRIKWAKALESGEYKQGYSVLGSRTACCCLGVACLAVLGHGRNEFGAVVNANGGTGVLSPQDMEKLGIDSREMSALVRLNDSFTADFLDIARIVRSADMVEGIRDFNLSYARETNQDHQD